MFAFSLDDFEHPLTDRNWGEVYDFIKLDDTRLLQTYSRGPETLLQKLCNRFLVIPNYIRDYLWDYLKTHPSIHLQNELLYKRVYRHPWYVSILEYELLHDITTEARYILSKLGPRFWITKGTNMHYPFAYVSSEEMFMFMVETCVGIEQELMPVILAHKRSKDLSCIIPLKFLSYEGLFYSFVARIITENPGLYNDWVVDLSKNKIDHYLLEIEMAPIHHLHVNCTPNSLLAVVCHLLLRGTQG